eukprot:m.420196 g.420196  ORF g.420196 m.420196 type:complete len:83 (-) comp56629_c0_seq62:553-801(-)
MTMRMQEGLLPQSDWMLAIEDDDAGHLAQRRDQVSCLLSMILLKPIGLLCPMCACVSPGSPFRSSIDSFIGCRLEIRCCILC